MKELPRIYNVSASDIDASELSADALQLAKDFSDRFSNVWSGEERSEALTEVAYLVQCAMERQSELLDAAVRALCAVGRAEGTCFDEDWSEFGVDDANREMLLKLICEREAEIERGRAAS